MHGYRAVKHLLCRHNIWHRNLLLTLAIGYKDSCLIIPFFPSEIHDGCQFALVCSTPRVKGRYVWYVWQVIFRHISWIYWIRAFSCSISQTVCTLLFSCFDVMISEKLHEMLLSDFSFVLAFSHCHTYELMLNSPLNIHITVYRLNIIFQRIGCSDGCLQRSPLHS